MILHRKEGGCKYQLQKCSNKELFLWEGGEFYAKTKTVCFF